MSDQFKIFAEKVRKQFERMAQHELFQVGVTGDQVWEWYLDAFPAGTNEIFRERTEHDCSCCKQFVRNIGNVVAIIDGEMVSVWDVAGLPHPYDTVARSLECLIQDQDVCSVYRPKERQFGVESNVEDLGEGDTRRWHHFHARMPRLASSPDRERGQINTNAQLFRRGLEELSIEAMRTVLELIDNGSLYRGEEHKTALLTFMRLKAEYNALSGAHRRNLYVWSHCQDFAATFRNTVIGTLVQDLSEGAELEAAVRSFEQKVAPTNYKRPTALITKRMVEDAMATINRLGYREALERRGARLSDVSVNNVLWVDNSVQGQMRDSLKDALMETVQTHTDASSVRNAEPINIETFMHRVVPHAQSMELYVGNNLQNAFMTLTAPMYEGVKPLFKWDNNFAWSYDGNTTDSIKERVKKAGGNVTAPLRVSLSWFNYDDLDIHVLEPNGNHIFFRNKSGKLDVDMNAGGGHSREAVENVSWQRPTDGVYSIKVNNYAKRENSDVGFVIELENDGASQQFSYLKAVPDGATVTVGTITVRGGKVVSRDFSADMRPWGASQQKWGISTEQFVKVSTLLHSPNHWDGNAVGNKHFFFILEGCKADEPVRGIYNEFLRSELEPHRKVFEVLGEKTKCLPAEDQLSGIGFSSTRGDHAVVSVTGEGFRKVYDINFKGA